MKGLANIFLTLSWFILLIGFFIRVQSGGEIRSVYAVGFGLVAISYGLRYWRKTGVRFTDTIKCVLIIFWCALEVIMVAPSRITFDRIVFYSFFLLGIVWLVSEIIDLIKGRTKGTRLILLLGAALMGLQVFMRVRHLPGAAIAQILSLTVVSVGFIAELMVVLRKR